MKLSKLCGTADQQHMQMWCCTTYIVRDQKLPHFLSLALGKSSRCCVRSPTTLRLPFMEKEKWWPVPEIPAIPALAPDTGVQKSSRMFQPQDMTCGEEPRPQTYRPSGATPAISSCLNNPLWRSRHCGAQTNQIWYTLTELLTFRTMSINKVVVLCQ